MKIEFDKIDFVKKDNFNGGEKYFLVKTYEDDSVKILNGKLEKGCSIGLHKHIDQAEILYVLEGLGTMKINNDIEILKKGDIHYCKKGECHTFSNNNDEDLIFFAVIPKYGK